MGVTEVVRGRDLLLSAAQQIYLYRLLGKDVPTYSHHPLLVNSRGQRLCKRDQSLAVGALRERYSAQDIIGRLAYAVRLIPAPEPVTPQQLLMYFSWSKIPNQDIMTDD